LIESPIAFTFCRPSVVSKSASTVIVTCDTCTFSPLREPDVRITTVSPMRARQVLNGM